MTKKLYVLLVHGTWAGGADWTQQGSPFRKMLEAHLAEIGYTPRFEAFPWNGKNRWEGRTLVTEMVNRQIDDAKKERAADWEFLVVAHSHGGNIATEAVRERLKHDPSLPIVGVVCLNTPFLLREVRGGISYLLVWFLVTLALLGMHAISGHTPRFLIVPDAVSSVAPFSSLISKLPVGWSLWAVALALASLLGLSRVYRRHARSVRDEPRPDVLCLSCPDDEAITFLGLGEGISNLPQLLLHPIALLLTLGLSLFVASSFDASACVAVNDCALETLAAAYTLFVLWVSIALVGGLAGAFAVTLLFGLPPSQILRTLVSRVLISYVPLRPANTWFRGVSDISLQWGNPLQLFHSAIYRSPQTVEEIGLWLQSRRAAGASTVSDER